MINPRTLPCEWPLGCDKLANGYDHDKQTDIVRAALCTYHNVALGHCGDQAYTLRKIADWLENASLGFTYREYIRAYEREKSSHRYAHRVLTNTDYLARRAEYARSHRQRTKTNGA